METNQKILDYKNFMFNSDNIRNCENCPENRDFDDWQDRLPCGQWHCWVAIHCEDVDKTE